MAVRIHSSSITDQNEQALNDAYLRNIRIQNIKKFDKENAPVWKGMQKALYPNTLELFPFSTLEQVLAEEDIESLNNYDIQRAKAWVNLLKITDLITADYILDRLEIMDVQYFNQNYNKVVKKVKTRGKLNRDVFVIFFKTANNDDKGGHDVVANVNKNNAITQAAIERQTLENTNLQSQAQEYEAKMKEQQDTMNQEGINYVNKLEAEKKARLKLKQRNQLSKFERLKDNKKINVLEALFPNIFDKQRYSQLSKTEILHEYADYLVNGVEPVFIEKTNA